MPDGIQLPSLQGGLGRAFFLPPTVSCARDFRERDFTTRLRERYGTIARAKSDLFSVSRYSLSLGEGYGEVLYPPITGINRSGHITVLALPSASLLEVDSQSDHQQRSLSFLLL